MLMKSFVLDHGSAATVAWICASCKSSCCRRMCAGWNSSVGNIALTVQLILLVTACSRVVLSAQHNEKQNVEDRQGKEASECTDQSSAQHACDAWEQSRLSFSVGVELLCHQDC